MSTGSQPTKEHRFFQHDSERSWSSWWQKEPPSHQRSELISLLSEIGLHAPSESDRKRAIALAERLLGSGYRRLER
jgi:hypothetical protein